MGYRCIGSVSRRRVSRVVFVEAGFSANNKKEEFFYEETFTGFCISGYYDVLIS